MVILHYAVSVVANLKKLHDEEFHETVYFPVKVCKKMLIKAKFLFQWLIQIFAKSVLLCMCSDTF